MTAVKKVTDWPAARSSTSEDHDFVVMIKENPDHDPVRH
jgi:hypothetical protein